jgi:hypothetical protein
MPLRDHFHPPLNTQRHWESFHHLWASVIVQHLMRRLSLHYFAEPRVHLGANVEVDVATFEQESTSSAAGETGNGIATAVWAPPRPPLTFAIDLPAEDVYEVRVYDESRGTRLVAAIELVSPSNKDRPEHRQAFAIKCVAYLQQQVSLVVVDVVTDRHSNLHRELLHLLQLTESPLWPEEVHLYAAAYRTTKEKDAWRMDVWPEQLALGAALPTMPLWLASDLAVPLELELTYEETCQVLRIR